MTNPLPKLGLLKLSLYVMDLLCVACDEDEIVQEPKVRIIWHSFFFSLVLLTILHLIFSNLLTDTAAKNHFFVYLYRYFHLIALIYLIFIFSIFVYRHYIYLFNTGRDIAFSNIISFYVMYVVFFGGLYKSIYLINPNFFIYNNLVFIPSANLIHLGTNGLLLLFDFIGYSFCVITNVSYPRIVSGSILVSMINAIEVICGIIIIVIFVSTFIQKNSHNKTGT